jgi:hypothetical protein
MSSSWFGKRREPQIQCPLVAFRKRDPRCRSSEIFESGTATGGVIAEQSERSVRRQRRDEVFAG